MSRRTRTLGFGLLVMVLAAALVYGAVGNPIDPFDNRRFSPDAWRIADLEARARMCRDIVRHVVGPGMPEKQVVALLGPPELVRDGRGGGGPLLPDRRIYQYSIGSWTMQRMDDAFLYVHIDPSDRVVMAEIYGY